MTGWKSIRIPDRVRLHKTALNLERLEDRLVPALVFGDFNGDTQLDLAIGSPGEMELDAAQSGAVNVIYNTKTGTGLDVANNRYFTQNGAPFGNGPKPGDRFGDVLAAGEFNGDGVADLAVGIPGEDLGSIRDAGAVQVFYGVRGTSGLTYTGAQYWHQD